MRQMEACYEGLNNYTSAREDMKNRGYPELRICTVVFGSGRAGLYQEFAALEDIKPAALHDGKEECADDSVSCFLPAMMLGMHALLAELENYEEMHREYYPPIVFLLAGRESLEAGGDINPKTLLDFAADYVGIPAALGSFQIFAADENTAIGLPYWLEWPVTASFAIAEEPDEETMEWLNVQAFCAVRH